jgi:hypothetical protein
MNPDIYRLRRAALGCVLEALPKWRKGGIRVANHIVRVGGEHREWLTVFRRDGTLVLWEHFPAARMIGTISPSDLGGGDRASTNLVRKVNALFAD